MNELFVGIDTSNYTTSVSLCNGEGEVLCNIKRLLDVSSGQRGLRQSDALFSHTKNLPELMDILSLEIKEKYSEMKISAVGYSAYPRDVEGSYMPCFLAGKAAAHSLASGLCVPVYKFSHQAGHIKAALYSSGYESEILSQARSCNGKFAAFHISGGTTEILLVTLENGEMKIEKIGGTRDINAGQAIDRAGVMVGLKFPCGREMESLCADGDVHVKICVDGLFCNLSGLENQAEKLYSQTGNAGVVSNFVFEFVGKTLVKMTENLRIIHPDIPIIYAGGVMSNRKIKSMLQGKNTFFAQPEFSSDNAAGIALLCRERHIE